MLLRNLYHVRSQDHYEKSPYYIVEGLLFYCHCNFDQSGELDLMISVCIKFICIPIGRPGFCIARECLPRKNLDLWKCNGELFWIGKAFLQWEFRGQSNGDQQKTATAKVRDRYHLQGHCLLEPGRLPVLGISRMPFFAISPGLQAVLKFNRSSATVQFQLEQKNPLS